MRTRRGFARHFLLLGATVSAMAAGSLVTRAVGARNSTTIYGGKNLPAPPRGVGHPRTSAKPNDWPPETTLKNEFQGGRVFYRYQGRTVPIIASAKQDIILQSGQLRGWSFLGTNFSGADLSGFDLRGCTFYDCELRGVSLASARMQGVRYDHLTRWPTGFDPEAHGARLEE